MRSVLLCLLFISCEKGGGKKVALRYHPPAGAVYHHTLEQYTRVDLPSAQLPGMMRQELRLRMYSTQTVKGPAAGGGTELEIVVDSASIDMPGMSPEVASRLARLRGTRSTVVFDDRAQLVRSDFAGLQGAPPPSPSRVPPELANQMAAVLKGMAYAFPEQPVGRGDAWTVSTELPIAQFGGTDASQAGAAQTTLTVREIRATAADTSVIFDITTSFPPGPIALSVAGQRGTMKLSGTLTGYQQFSLSRGTVVDANMKGSSKIHVTVAALGMRDMAVTTQTENSIRLAGGAQ